MNTGVDGSNPSDSDSDIPLMSADQHWEEHAANAAADPIPYAPKPRVNSNVPFSLTMSKLPSGEETDDAARPFIGHGHDQQENGETGIAGLDSNAPLIGEFEFSRSRGVSVASPSR